MDAQWLQQPWAQAVSQHEQVAGATGAFTGKAVSAAAAIRALNMESPCWVEGSEGRSIAPQIRQTLSQALWRRESRPAMLSKVIGAGTGSGERFQRLTDETAETVRASTRGAWAGNAWLPGADTGQQAGPGGQGQQGADGGTGVAIHPAATKTAESRTPRKRLMDSSLTLFATCASQRRGSTTMAASGAGQPKVQRPQPVQRSSITSGWSNSPSAFTIRMASSG